MARGPHGAALCPVVVGEPIMYPRINEFIGELHMSERFRVFWSRTPSFLRLLNTTTGDAAVCECRRAQ